jgi:hypothetical protein
METAKEICDHFINRAKKLNEFTITTDVPEDFRFNGLVPFDMTIQDNVITAKVWGIDFDEAVSRFNEYMEGCK